jgi:hypothetical protein
MRVAHPPHYSSKLSHLPSIVRKVLTHGVITRHDPYPADRFLGGMS